MAARVNGSCCIMHVYLMHPGMVDYLTLQCRAAILARCKSPSRRLPLASGPVQQPQFLRVLFPARPMTTDGVSEDAEVLI
jgi:hypothetical protein